MYGSQLNRRVVRWLEQRFGRGEAHTAPRVGRDPTVHVIIIDGTMSSLAPDCIGNAGLSYRLMQEMGSAISLFYHPGLQWSHWRRAGDVIAGRGINQQIRIAYSWLASRYRPGDRVFLLGFSRGGYAVRSLAGIIDRVGLLRTECATERNVRDAYRHYRHLQSPQAAAAFRQNNCHAEVPIEMIGVWDTVKSLGLNMPLLWRLSVPKHAFHNHQLGDSVRHGYQALARHETRVAYSPVLWETNPAYPGRMVQMWFPGVHGDIGGQIGAFQPARPLSHISLVWMLEQAESVGLPLPENWQERFPRDATAPSMGTFRGAARWLITRKPRVVGIDASERVHPTVAEARNASSEAPGWLPRLLGRA